MNYHHGSRNYAQNDANKTIAVVNDPGPVQALADNECCRIACTGCGEVGQLVDTRVVWIAGTCYPGLPDEWEYLGPSGGRALCGFCIEELRFWADRPACSDPECWVCARGEA